MKSTAGNERAVKRGTRYGPTVATGRQAGRLGLVAPVAGAAAGLAMIVVGCRAVTDGAATIDKADAPEYRASVSSSSVARESERREAAAKDAVHASCDVLEANRDDVVDAVNDYVKAYNVDASEAPAKAGPAIESLNGTADALAGSLSDPLPPDLKGELDEFIDSARQLAVLITQGEIPDVFNVAIRRLDDAQASAGAGCDAAY